MGAESLGPVLEEATLERFRPMGVFGRPAWQSHLQLRTLLRQRLGARYADCFAIPSADPVKGTMRWISPCAGQSRRWLDFDEAERQKRGAELETLMRSLSDFAQSLRGEGRSPASDGGSTGQALASLIEAALRTPAQGAHLHWVGEQPVWAFWGFEAHDGQSQPVLPSLQDSKVLPPLPEAPEAVAAPTEPTLLASAPTPPPQPLSASAAAEPLAPRPTESLHPREAHARLWWQEDGWLGLPRLLWSALLFLATLLLLLLLLRSCGARLPGLGGGLSGAASSQGPIGLPETPPAPLSQMSSGQGGAAGSPALVTGGPSDPATAPQAPGVTPSTNPPLLPSAPAGEEVQPKEKGLQIPPAAGPGQTPGQTPGQDLSFLAGRWQAGQGLIDRRSGQPLDLEMNFNRDGQGELAVRRPGASPCVGSVRGLMAGGKLSIAGPEELKCEDGPGYAPPRIECAVTRSGQTDCYGLNADGSRYFMEIRRR